MNKFKDYKFKKKKMMTLSLDTGVGLGASHFFYGPYSKNDKNPDLMIKTLSLYKLKLTLVLLLLDGLEVGSG